MEKGLLRQAPRLDPEDDEGSVEYKWRLNPQSMTRLESLGTQMKFRIVEGAGVCHYYIGYRDDGDPKGLSEAELESSLQTLERIAASISAVVRVKEVFKVEARSNTKKTTDPASKSDGCPLYTALCEVTLSKAHVSPSLVPKFIQFLGRVAFVGLPGVGKTTLIGALVSESRDDGRGSLRFSTSKLVHEVLNGGTTCAATAHNFQVSQAERLELLDLPSITGKYRKTLLKALVTKPIDLVVFVEDEYDTGRANNQTAWLQTLNIPILRVLSKADVLGRGGDGSTLRVSTVTGEGLEELKGKLVHALRERPARKSVETSEVCLAVDEAWMKEEVYVVGGVLESGSIRKGMTLRVQSARISEICRIKDIRDEAGNEVGNLEAVGRYCTVGIEKFPTLSHAGEEISTAASSSGEYLLSKARIPSAKLMRPPLLLASEILKFPDSISVVFPGDVTPPDVPASGIMCMAYWRGNRQQARLHKVMTTPESDAKKVFTLSLNKGTFSGVFSSESRLIVECATVAADCRVQTYVVCLTASSPDSSLP